MSNFSSTDAALRQRLLFAGCFTSLFTVMIDCYEDQVIVPSTSSSTGGGVCADRYLDEAA